MNYRKGYFYYWTNQLRIIYVKTGGFLSQKLPETVIMILIEAHSLTSQYHCIDLIADIKEMLGRISLLAPKLNIRGASVPDFSL